MGGRSRVAAQMLSGKGFSEVYNLAGGIKGWTSESAFGVEELGLSYFEGAETPETNLIVAYSLEQGLRDFYLSMIPAVKNKDARDLFQKLADIEINHQNRIYNEYLSFSEQSVSREEFEQSIVARVAEGGLTTQEYLNIFKPDLESSVDIISLAMSIEAQALDLYQRAADKTSDERSKKILMKIAEEERVHLNELGKLMDSMNT